MSVSCSFCIQTLSGLPDQDTFYDVVDCLEELGIAAVSQRHLTKKGTDLDLVEQLNIYEVTGYVYAFCRASYSLDKRQRLRETYSRPVALSVMWQHLQHLGTAKTQALRLRLRPAESETPRVGPDWLIAILF